MLSNITTTLYKKPAPSSKLFSASLLAFPFFVFSVTLFLRRLPAGASEVLIPEDWEPALDDLFLFLFSLLLLRSVVKMSSLGLVSTLNRTLWDERRFCFSPSALARPVEDLLMALLARRLLCLEERSCFEERSCLDERALFCFSSRLLASSLIFFYGW